MARFVPGSNEKHGIEMKIKELNPVEERNFLCKLCHQNRNLMVGKIEVL